MTRTLGCFACLLFLLGYVASVYSTAAIAQSPSPREQLQQYVAELQKNPNDQALREKIIKLAQTLEPKPAIPKEANRPFVMAVTFQKEAKDAAGYELAIKAYREALLLAPWWPEANWNLSVAQEAAGHYDDAMITMKLYLLTKPEDASQAETRLYALEAKKTMAEREAASPRALAAQAKKKDEEFLKRLDGGKWVRPGAEENVDCVDFFIEIQGGQVTVDKQVVVRRSEYCWIGARIGDVVPGRTVVLPQNVGETRVFSVGEA